jgi:iron complex outermembrane receptor protein
MKRASRRLARAVAPAMSVLAYCATASAQTAAPANLAPAAPAPAPGSAAPGVTVLDDIVVTATRRSENLSRVPIAVSAVTGAQLRATGATDIRGLIQIAPSLNVNTSSSETVAVARIRNIGTSGNNFGLESSVATFVDGVYRARSGIALGELGDVERIEVLRGPQGTLFGRNASAGLINIISQAPEFTLGGHAQVDVGNYAERRFDGSLTGPLGASELAAFRVQGIYEKRDGFFRDLASGERVNNRDRYFFRGQLLLKPSEQLTVRLIGDYTHHDENCCLANFLPAEDVGRGANGALVVRPSSVANLERLFGGTIVDDPDRRAGSITPGQSFRSVVRDWGFSGQVDWDLGGAALTSITAYRDYRNPQALDPDYSNLDLLQRTRYVSGLRNFSQELRLQGKAFSGRLDWLVGGYFANERAHSTDNFGVGSQYGRFQACQIAGGLASGLGLPASSVLAPAASGCINPAFRPALGAALGPAGAPVLAAFDRLSTFGDVLDNDSFTQRGRNFAIFTHNNFEITDKLTLTAGLRWTHDRKSLDASLGGALGICSAQRATVGALTGPGVPATLQSLAGSLLSVSCPSNVGDAITGQYRASNSTDQWTGTAVASYRATKNLLTYASYSRGYKAGGYNLDRSGIMIATPVADRAAALEFDPERVTSYEVGAKLALQAFRFNVAAFWEDLSGFQYNIFNGTNFVVVNIDGCDQTLAPVAGSLPTLGRCAGSRKPGVFSRGVELEANLSPAQFLAVQAGLTVADTQFRKNITGSNGAPLPNGLALLPGSRLPYAPRYTLSSAVTYTPDLSDSLKGLAHIDARFQSGFNTGSDLFPEKQQPRFVVVNARIGVSASDGRWSLEGWARNLFNAKYSTLVTGAPTQGSGTAGYVERGYTSTSTGLFTNFLGDPRTYGVTMRVQF